MAGSVHPHSLLISSIFCCWNHPPATISPSFSQSRSIGHQQSPPAAKPAQPAGWWSKKMAPYITIWIPPNHPKVDQFSIERYWNLWFWGTILGNIHIKQPWDGTGFTGFFPLLPATWSSPAAEVHPAWSQRKLQDAWPPVPNLAPGGWDQLLWDPGWSP